MADNPYSKLTDEELAKTITIRSQRKTRPGVVPAVPAVYRRDQNAPPPVTQKVPAVYRRDQNAPPPVIRQVPAIIQNPAPRRSNTKTAAGGKISLEDAMKLLEKHGMNPTPTPSPTPKPKVRVKDAIKEGAKEKYRGIGARTGALLEQVDD